METKFTKGQWTYYETGGGFEVVQNIHQFPIPTRTAIIPYNDAEGEANAKLIASAPDLFRMLNKIANIEDYAFTLSAFDVARLKAEINEVIDKALR